MNFSDGSPTIKRYSEEATPELYPHAQRVYNEIAFTVSLMCLAQMPMEYIAAAIFAKLRTLREERLSYGDSNAELSTLMVAALEDRDA